MGLERNSGKANANAHSASNSLAVALVYTLLSLVAWVESQDVLCGSDLYGRSYDLSALQGLTFQVSVGNTNYGFSPCDDLMPCRSGDSMLTRTDSSGECNIISRWNSETSPVTGNDWAPADNSISLTTEDGDSCVAANQSYSFSVNFICSTDYASPPSNDIRVLSPEDCTVIMQFPTCWACENEEENFCEKISNISPSPTPSVPSPSGVSAGVVILIVLLVGILAYIFIGMIIGYCQGRRGISMFPNLLFWNHVCRCRCFQSDGYQSF